MKSANSAVIFDMDGVLYDFDSEARFRAFSQLSGKSVEILKKEIWNGAFEHNAEQGTPSLSVEYVTELSRLLDTPISSETWISIRKAAMRPKTDVLNLAEQVSRRTEIAMLSNNSVMLKDSLGHVAPEANFLFAERAHVSAEFGARKPDIQVFHRICTKYEHAPEVTLFIDDNPEFVSGAGAAGLHTHLFTTADTLRSHLHDLNLIERA